MLLCITGSWAAPLGLHCLLNPQDLAMPLEGTIRMVGTTAGEGDGEDYKLLAPGQTAEILTVEGPAVIHRIWSTSQHTDKTRLTMKLDGKEQVIWDQAKLPEGQAADDPLRAMDGQAYWSYIPVKVNTTAQFIATDLREAENEEPETVDDPLLGRVEISAENGNKFYLQVAYSSSHDGFLADGQVQEVRERLAALAENPLLGASGIVVEGADQQPKTEEYTLKPGEPVKIAGDAKAYLQMLIFDVGETPFENLTRTRLIITPAGATGPSVDVPLPYLFCAYWSLDEYTGPVTAIQGRKLIFRLPVPVGNGLEIGIDKLGKGAAADSVKLTCVKGVSAEPIPYVFCAQYASIVSTRGEPLHLADIKGEGVFLGGTFAADGLEHRKFSFLEGNEQIYVDGEEKPSWEGTGTEDYFNGAWYFSAGVKARAFHGLTHLDENPPPQMASYRYLLPDRIAFKQGLKFDMQHGSRNSVPDTLYRAVSFWYQKPPCTVSAPEEAELPEGTSVGLGVGTDDTEDAGPDMLTPTILAIIALLLVVLIVRFMIRRRR